MTVLAVEIVFWVAAVLVVYPYVVYPVVLRWLAARSAPTARPTVEDGELPRVTLVVSAYNEDAVIAEKLDNALALDYPADRLEVMVVSDASSDRTDAIVRDYAARDPRVKLLRQSERRGKSAGLNRAVAASTADVVVFSDANAMYEAGAIRTLVTHFARPEVGYVVGAALYRDSDESEAKQSEGLYWRLELWLKAHESRFVSVVGGDGAIYAVRRALFWDLRDDDISDFVNPLQVVAAGHRGVFEPDARCYEDSADGFGKEFRRKRRIVNRSWRAVKRYAGRLRLGRDAPFVFCLLSHKVIRWYAMAFVLLALAANALLVASGAGALYLLTLAVALATFGLAAAGWLLDRAGHAMPRPVYIPYYFYLVNLAGLLGIWDEFRGVRHATWEHVRQA
ncbi:MAG: glycosyltransferase family 2 protein [Ectothiorhodospiraceae bacterium]|nr:glycosyltransferase family 2 protein [Ectothiorhodospiraceae bacterium]